MTWWPVRWSSMRPRPSGDVATRVAVLFLILLEAAVARGLVIDRILAVVNGQPVTLTAVEAHLTFIEQVEPASPDSFSDEQISAGLDRVIDHELLLAEAGRFGIQEEPGPDAIASALARVRKQYPDDQAFQRELLRYAMDTGDLEEMLRKDWMVQEFIRQRISFFVIVFPEEISQYYAEHYETFQGKTLDQVRDQIEQVLFELKKRKRLDEYVSRLRARARIELRQENIPF